MALLQNIHHIRELRFTGNYDASNLILDFYEYIEKARLTKKQKAVLFLVFEKDLTQSEAGKVLGISQQRVNEQVRNCVRKIAQSVQEESDGEI